MAYVYRFVHSQQRAPVEDLFSNEERAAIGQYAELHGSTRAARQYGVSESTVRGIKRKYNEALLESSDGSVPTSLPKGKLYYLVK